jgi:tyramine---L-glutamate ligase
MMRMDSSPKPIFVHEFVSGGGCAGEALPPGLLAEGYAMLRAVLTDFARWGRFPIITTLDSRLGAAALPATRVERVEPGDYADLYRALVTESQAVLIIAPETDSVLKSLTATAEELGVPVLGSSSAATQVAGDKWACYRYFRQAGLTTPPVRRARFDGDVEAAARNLCYPLVIKPVDGVACVGVLLVNSRANLPQALDRLRALTRRDDFLLMEYVAGTHASVSLLVSASGSRPLTLNRQNIAVAAGQFVYDGGTIPLEHRLSERALAVAAQAVSLIPGLSGYVGVDLVLADKAAFVIEINPRLTTSYVGVRAAVGINLAEAIWHACIDAELPRSVPVQRQVDFAKKDLALNSAIGGGS